MTAPADDYDNLMLDRLLEMGDALTAIKATSKYLWEMPTGPFPMLIFSIGQVTHDHTSGEGKMTLTYRLRARLLGGPLGAGAIHETEDNVNKVSFRVLRMLVAFKNLEQPDADGNPRISTDFDHLSPEGARVVSVGDMTQF